MRTYRLISTAIGGVFFAGVSSAAHAGCFGAPATTCNQQIIPISAPADRLVPINVYGQNPYGYLRTFNYKNTPNVNVMRLRSHTQAVQLNDAPGTFNNGCNPAKVYCTTPPARLPIAPPAPQAMPYIAPPAPVQSRVTMSSGYNASAFAPRQYGSLDFVPGIAHVPTSTVDRSPITHINGIPQPIVRSITTAPLAPATFPMPSMTSSSYSTSRSFVANTMPTQRPNGNVLGNVVTNQYTYQPEGGGAYWERTSGPTIVGGLPATQILCRREAPRPDPVNVQVVSPVIGVPMPVPTPVPVPFNTCGGVTYGNGFAPPVLAGGPAPAYSRYGSRWTY